MCSSDLVRTWQKWGIPEEKTITVKPGDAVKIKDINVVALEAFDRTDRKSVV